MKKVLCLILALAMIIGCCACGSKSADRLIIGTMYTIDEAVRGNYNFDMLSSGTAQPPVVSQNTDGSFAPILVDWSTEDSKTWTFTVKEGMKWSDGQDLTADDIKAAIKSEDTLSDMIESITAFEKKLVIILKDANVRFLSNMTYIRPVPTHNAEDGTQLWCGPYVLEEYNKEAGTVSFAVNEYYPEKPSINNIVFQLFASEDTMYLALQNGDIDMVWNYSAGIPVNYQSVLTESGSVKLLSCSAANVPAVLAFNNARGPFTDKNLRLAVSCALNYDEIKSYLGSDLSEIPRRGFVPSATIGFKETETLAQDLSKAADYMASAGYASKNENGFYVDANGNEAAFTLTINAGKEAHVSAGELIKNQLEDFGIRVELETLDSTAYNAKTSNKFSESNITMEAAIFGYTTAGMGMGAGLGTIYVDARNKTQGGCQVSGSFLGLVDSLEYAKNMDEYNLAAGNIQDYYAEECPLIALYWDNLVYGLGDNIENDFADANFGLNNIRNWYAKQ